MWGFKKPVGSVLDQERDPGGSTVIRLLIWPLGARAQRFHVGLTVILFPKEAFPGGDTGPKGRITSGPQEGRPVWSNSARSLGEMSRIPREAKLAAGPGIPAAG